MDSQNPTNEGGTQSGAVLLKHPESKSELKVDRQIYNKLMTAYNQAVADGKDSFVFDGHEFVVGYAKYLLEYIDGKLS